MTVSPLALLGGKPCVSKSYPFSWPPISTEDVEAVVGLLKKKELSYYGREGQIEQLEAEFSSYIGADYALSTSSGTAALHSAFFALGLEPGSQVLVPTYTFLATVMPLFVVNAVPVLVDADPLTGNMCPVDLERKITADTRAVVLTHMWGLPCDMERIVHIARKRGLRIVEDCSHAHGASYMGKKVGAFGDVAAFSLQGKKLVAAGQGGILVTSDQEIYERATLLGHFKVRSLQEVTSPEYSRFSDTGFGLNYRMHPLGAAIANVQLRSLETYIEGRRSNFLPFSERLQGLPGVHPPTEEAGIRHVFYSYKPTYEAEELDGLSIELFVKALQAEGVDVSRSKTRPLHFEPVFQEYPTPMVCYDRFTRPVYSLGDFPGAERYANSALSFTEHTTPVHDMLEEYGNAIEKVIEHRNDLLRFAERDKA